MQRALSIDLRICVVAAVDSGASHREAAERFGVSAASGSRWRYLKLQEENIRPGPLGGDRNSHKTEAHFDQIMTWLGEHRDSILPVCPYWMSLVHLQQHHQHFAC